MLAFPLSTSSTPTLSLFNKNLITFKARSQIPQSYSYVSRLCHHYVTPPLNQQQHQRQQYPSSAFLGFNPLRVSVKSKGVVMKKKKHGLSAVCYAAPLTTANLQWVAVVSTVILMLAKGTAIHRSFLVPLFALQAPNSIITWIRGEYGIWTAFLALLVRLFFFIPGELELPFVALLLVIVAPHQAMNLRGKQEGVIISFIIAGYLAFQHFLRAGSLRRAFDQDVFITLPWKRGPYFHQKIPRDMLE